MITLSIVITCIVAICLFWFEVVLGLICGLFSLIFGLIFKLFTTWWGWMLIFIGIAIALCV